MDVVQGFVNPMASTFQHRSPAPPMAAPGRIGLVDMMLNPASGWGQALLTGAERALEPRGATFGRERRHPLLGETVDEWTVEMRKKYGAAVLAVGD
jgi:hypothetical protein